MSPSSPLESPASVRAGLDDYVAGYLREAHQQPSVATGVPTRDDPQVGLDARLASLATAGILESFPNRRLALRRFAPVLQRSRTAIIVGSSLKGLIHPEGSDQEIRDVVRQRVRRQLEGPEGEVMTDFVLTHPGLADLRAEQESREQLEIGREVIKSLVYLKDWGVPPSSVHLYLGTPTCFGVQTDDQMILNPYPYADVAFESPCLLLSDAGYFFRVFAKAHFGILDRTTMVRLSDFDEDIGDLVINLKEYQARTTELLSVARISTKRRSSDAERDLERLPGFLDMLTKARKRHPEMSTGDDA